MSSYTRWSDARAAHVERAGGEQVVEAGKQELLATVVGHRLAEVRRLRGPTLPQPAAGCPTTVTPRDYPRQPDTHLQCKRHHQT